MKVKIILVLSALALIIFAAASCTTATKPAETKPAAQEIIKKPEIQPPVIKDILGPQSAALSENTTFVCWAIDPDGRKMTFAWAVEQGRLFQNGTKDVIWTTPEKPGNYTISVKVTNDAGLEASFSKAFKIEDVPDSHKYTDATIYLKLSLSNNDIIKTWSKIRVNDTSEIQCSVENNDVADLNFKWNAPVGKLSGNNLAEGKAFRVGWSAPGVPDKYTVSVTVTDQSGREARGEVTFDVYVE